MTSLPPNASDQRPRRVFLVGCPRSGTTLVQSLLAAGEGITSFTESHFFDRVFPPAPLDRWLVREPTARLAAFRAENGLEDRGTGADEAAGEGPAEAAAAFVALLDQTARDRSCWCWVEKTPDHLFRIPLIRRYLPEAEFVHVLREPAATVRSLVRASRDWGNPRSELFCAIKWLVCARRSRRYLRAAGHTAVFYEDLVADPETAARSLYQALGLAWSPDIMERYRDVARDLVVSTETWKNRNFGAIEAGAPAATGRSGLIDRLLERTWRDLHGARG